MKIKNNILFLLLLVSFSALSAEQSLRKCALLPITDSVSGAIGFKVFQKVEEYLKDSSWCVYKYNSDIINILGNYRQNLATHLQNKEVLKLFGEKVGAGSLIKIKLNSQIKGIEALIEIFGSNGEDLYFRDKSSLEDDNVDNISKAIINWLEIYERSIPYDGRIISVLGEQFTMDIGRASNIKIGNALVVKRPTYKREHPLLKEIVEWESEIIGKGQVFSVSDEQAGGVIKTYYGKNKLAAGDWVRVDRASPDNQIKEMQFPEVQEHQFGKLGTLSIHSVVGQGSISSLFKGTSRKIAGFNLGFYSNINFWATRNIFALAELGQLFGSYSGKNAQTKQTQNTVSKGIYKLGGGYKFLPLGFFYGPQVDVYGGWGLYSVNPDTRVDEGYGEWALKGIFLGINGDAPVHRNVRVHVKFEMIPFGDYTEDTILYGSEESAQTFDLQFGSKYLFSPLLAFDLALNFISSKATFKLDNAQIQSKDLSVKLGATFTF